MGISHQCKLQESERQALVEFNAQDYTKAPKWVPSYVIERLRVRGLVMVKRDEIHYGFLFVRRTRRGERMMQRLGSQAPAR